MKLGGWIRLAQAGRLKVGLLALWKLFRHPATPWFVKAIAVAVVAYAVSPIDLIPDFIPVLGQLDDLLLLPLGVALAVRLTPPALWAHCLREAEEGLERLPRLLWGALLVVLVWFGLIIAAAWVWYRLDAGAQAAPVRAAVWVEGSVHRVVDGDTLEFRPSDSTQPRIAVRLRGIDAPETCQAWGRQATAALRDLVQGQAVSLRIHGQDDYRRTLGTLQIDGEDLNGRLVAQGHAWAWRDAHGRSPYLKQEASARSAGRGLHVQPEAQTPWDFRREHGRCRR